MRRLGIKPWQAVDLISRNALASGSRCKNTAKQPGANARRLMVRLNQQAAKRLQRTERHLRDFSEVFSFQASQNDWLQLQDWSIAM